MRLFLMRHGETDYNLRALCNDDPRVDVHLTAHGIAQAKAASEKLREVPLDAILISELPRTRQTAEIVNRYHGAPILVRPELNDIRSGFEGRPVTAYFAAVGADRMDLRPPGGESLRDYQARVLPVLDWLRERCWTTVLIVAHEETLRVLAAALRDLSEDRMLGLNFGNCEIVEFADGRIDSRTARRRSRPTSAS